MSASKIIDQILALENLDEGIQQLTLNVKNHPQDSSMRSALFEALCFRGDLERAEKQLEALTGLAVKRPDVLLTYKFLIQAEKQRRLVFAGKSRPAFVDTPSDSAVHRLNAVTALALKNNEVFSDELLKARETQSPAREYSCQEQSGLALRDYDDLIGPVLEFFHQDGQYYWIEQEHLLKIVPAEVQDWIDTLWRPATLELQNGTVLKGYLPVIYQGTFQESHAALSLGRMTDWRLIGEHLYRGVGQRLFLSDETEVPVLELQPVLFK